MSYFQIALDPWDEYKMKNKIFSKKKLRMDIIENIMIQNNGMWRCKDNITTRELLQHIQLEKNLGEEWLDSTYEKIISHKKTKLFGTVSTRTPTFVSSPSMSPTQLQNFLTLIPE